MIRQLVLRNVIHRPMRTIISMLAVAVEVTRQETPVVVYPRTLEELFMPRPFALKNNG